MKKLNNRGWGLSTFVAFIAVFCIAILLIIIGALRLGMTSRQDVSKLPVTEATPTPTISTNQEREEYFEQVKNYQTQLLDIAKNYVSIHPDAIIQGDSLTITIVSLVRDNYISKLEINGNICTGYVTIRNLEKNYEYSPFVNCGDGYVTEKYDSNLDESF